MFCGVREGEIAVNWEVRGRLLVPGLVWDFNVWVGLCQRVGSVQGLQDEMGKYGDEEVRL